MSGRLIGMDYGWGMTAGVGGDKAGESNGEKVVTIKTLCIYSYIFKLQSPLKYCPSTLAKYFCLRTFSSWETNKRKAT